MRWCQRVLSCLLSILRIFIKARHWSIHGVKQSGILSQQRLVEHLAKHRYIKCRFTQWLFIHDSNGTAFSLVVEDFLEKYKIDAAGQHLASCLQELHKITADTVKGRYLVTPNSRPARLPTASHLDRVCQCLCGRYCLTPSIRRSQRQSICVTIGSETKIRCDYLYM